MQINALFLIVLISSLTSVVLYLEPYLNALKQQTTSRESMYC